MDTLCPLPECEVCAVLAIQDRIDDARHDVIAPVDDAGIELIRPPHRPVQP